MIRAIRPSAMAQDDASLVSGWNIAPNVAYTLVLLPGGTSRGVLLLDETGSTLVASGAALVGTNQPCVLAPQSGQTISMVDVDLGWHLLLSTTGTESQRTIRIGPAVDLPDEIHPVYGNDDLALARATAAIDAATHYPDDVTVSCPRDRVAGLGGVASVPVDESAVVGQVESITWVGMPDSAIETAVIRQHVAIAPDAYVAPTPLGVVDDTGSATHLTGAVGNVLANDGSGLTVVAVNGLSANVGVAVDGDNGGSFVINADGSWTFDPGSDFGSLAPEEFADTRAAYHASDGTAEEMGALTVTVIHENSPPVAVDDTAEAFSNVPTSGNVLANDADAEGAPLTVSRVNGVAGNVGVTVPGSGGGLFTIGGDGGWSFDPNGEFDTLAGSATATTSVAYHVSDGEDEDEGVLTLTVSAAQVEITLVGSATAYGNNGTYGTLTLPAVQPGDLILLVAGDSCSGCTPDIQVQTSGYTQYHAQMHAPAYRAVLKVFYKIADGSETEISLRGVNNSYYKWTAVAQIWRGVDQTAPFDVEKVGTVQTNAQPNSPSITPVTQAAQVITAATAFSSTAASNPVPPSGYDGMSWQTYCPANWSGNTVVVASKEWAGSGAEDPGAWSGIVLGSNCAVVSVTMALRPAV